MLTTMAGGANASQASGAAEVDGWTFNSIGLPSTKVTEGYIYFNNSGDYIFTTNPFSTDITNVVVRVKVSTTTAARVLSLQPMFNGSVDLDAAQLFVCQTTVSDQSFAIGPGYNGVRLYLNPSQGGTSGTWTVQAVTIYTKDPQFDTPTDLASSNIDYTSFDVSWSQVSDATNYVFQYWVVGANATNEVSTGTTATKNLTDLSAGTTYGCRVKAQGEGIFDSDWTDDLEVTTLLDYVLPVWSVSEVPAFIEGVQNSFRVSATLSDVPAAVAFEELIPAASGTAPTFAAGTFSWTPSSGSAGNYTARFTVTDGPRVHTNDVALSVGTATRVETLFWEPFDHCDKTWSNNTFVNDSDGGETLLNYVPNNNGWLGYRVSKGPSAIRLGTSANGGYAITPEITLTNFLSTGFIQLSFAAATVTNSGKSQGQVQFDVLDATNGVAYTYRSESLPLTKPNDGNATLSDEEYQFGPFIVEVPSPFRVKFSAWVDGRVCLDSVFVGQSVRTDLPTLAIPTGLTAEADGYHALSVSWNAVTDATGYVLEVSESGEVVTNVVLSGTSVTVTDLPDDLEYSLRVRSTGDAALCFGSEWSGSVQASTPHDPDRPDFYLNPAVIPVFYAQVGAAFDISATNNLGAAVPVQFVSVRPLPLTEYGYSHGTFTWVPTIDDQGEHTVTFSAQTAGGVYLYRVTITAADRPALQVPVVEEEDHDCTTVSLSWDNQDASDLLRLTKWRLRVWSGAVGKDDVHYRENFYDNRIPAGWSISKHKFATQNSEQMVAFQQTDGYAISPLFPAPVTNLAFHTKCSRGKSASFPNLDVLTLSGYSTVSNGWVLLAAYTNVDGNIKYPSMDFLQEDGFVRFMWEHTETGYTAYLGTVVAQYAGDGARFVVGSKDTLMDFDKSEMEYVLQHLAPTTDYFVELHAIGDASPIPEDLVNNPILRCSTDAAPKGTVIFLR